jgi:hypothetical protein
MVNLQSFALRITRAAALLYFLGALTANAALLTNGAGFTGFPFGGYQCADIGGGSPPAPGQFTVVQAWDCHGWSNQQWALEGLAILGMSSTGGVRNCLDVLFAGTAPGTRVNLFQCNGTGAQQWHYFNGQLVNLRSGLCLDAGNQANGTQLVINTCNGSDRQRWQIK